MALISIIIPAYNCEATLERCLNSIIDQNFKDFEILLIDDGSTDNTPVLCDSFAAKDTRVRVNHKQNGGVSSARNVGLSNSKGEWITFVDSDDELTEGALDRIIIAIGNNPELILTNAFMIDVSGNCFPILPSRVTSTSQMYDLPLNGSCCNKVFQRRIIDNKRIRFDESLAFYEDWLFVGRYCSDVRDLEYISEPCYINYLPECYAKKYAGSTDFRHTIYFYSKLKPFNKELSDKWVDSLVMKLLSESNGYHEITQKVLLLKDSVGDDICCAKGRKKALIRSLAHTNHIMAWNIVFYLHSVLFPEKSL